LSKTVDTMPVDTMPFHPQIYYLSIYPCDCLYPSFTMALWFKNTSGNLNSAYFGFFPYLENKSCN